MRVQVKLRVNLPIGRQGAIQLVQQPPFELARLDLELCARRPIDDANRHAGMPDAVTQLGGEVPLDLLAAEILDAREDSPDENLRSAIGEKRRLMRDAKAR